jgi:hypothetical protein
MKIKELLKKLKGTHTIKSIMASLDVSRNKAIYYIYRLRKQGYVKTKRMSNKTRVYNISFENKLKSITYEEIINKNSPIKIRISEKPYIYGRTPSLEETFVYAVKTRDLRIILAALSLFKKISNWKFLYNLAKDNYVEREVGALYDLSRKIIKTKRISGNFIRNALPKKEDEFKFIVKNLKSKEFTDIQEKWKVYLPFNKKDLEVYK